MNARPLRIGEVFSEKRICQPSTGYRCVLVRLKNLALLEEKLEYSGDDRPGAHGTQKWAFEAVAPGPAEIQFAKFRPFEPEVILYEEVLPFIVGDEAELNGQFASPILSGGWHGFTGRLEQEDQTIFQQATALIGTGYTPLVETHQIVRGKMYIFLANAKSAVKDADTYPVAVRIYADIKGTPELKEIKVIGRPGVKGAYEQFKEASSLSAEENNAIKEAFYGHTGIDFTPLLVSTQIVAGRNLLLAGNANTVTLHPAVRPVLVNVYIPVLGTPRITEIKNIYDL
ncbi:MAG: protease inhibitor I42 family protein [Treponema sp.]|jgi:predicted secreted protein|nr:protease inhibitor I42 family protein [Treponema sp.]